MADVIAAAAEAAKGKRVQQSFYISEDAKERMRSVAYWSRAAVLAANQRGEEVDHDYVPQSIAAGVERGMWAVILGAERALNGGEPFPPAPEKMPTGPSMEGVERLRDFQRGEQAKRRAAKEASGGEPGQK